MNIITQEIHHFYSKDFDKEEQDKEIIIDDKLTYSINKGLEMEYENGKDTDSPFYGKAKLQTLYMTNKGTIQHNIEDGSFYFTRLDNTMASYVDGKLMIEDPNGEYDEFIEFANTILH